MRSVGVALAWGDLDSIPARLLDDLLLFVEASRERHTETGQLKQREAAEFQRRVFEQGLDV